MDTTAIEPLIFIVLTLGVIAIMGLTCVLFARNILQEVDDEHAEYSRYRREEYQKERVHIALLGLVTLMGIVLITGLAIWVFN